MDNNGNNVKSPKKQLFNYLINYLTENRNRNRRTTTVRLNPEVLEEFRRIAYLRFSLHNFKNSNVLIEGLLAYFNSVFKVENVIQTTLFYKPTIIQQQQTINIGLKIQVKMVKQDLENILESLEQERGDPYFYMQKLRKTIERASKLYNSTRDPQLKILLERAENWI